MRCDQCKHWNREGPVLGYRAVPSLGRCGQALELWDATEWTENENDEDDYCIRTVKPEYADRMLFVQDGSDYRAEVWTKPEFFCAHFEQSTQP